MPSRSSLTGQGRLPSRQCCPRTRSLPLLQRQPAAHCSREHASSKDLDLKRSPPSGLRLVGIEHDRVNDFAVPLRSLLFRVELLVAFNDEACCHNDLESEWLPLCVHPTVAEQEL